MASNPFRSLHLYLFVVAVVAAVGVTVVTYHNPDPTKTSYLAISLLWTCVGMGLCRELSYLKSK